MRQIVLDTETTGLETSQDHRIIEIGCVEVVNRKLTGRHYHQYINPQRAVDAGAFEVHGIGDEFLADKPLFSQIVDEFMAFVEGAELVIHNAPFDVGFINHELSKLNPAPSAIDSLCKITDTLVMARQKHPGQRNSLDALCKRYFVDNSQRDLHGALLDAEILADVYLAMTGGQVALMMGDSQSEQGGDGRSGGIRRLDSNRAALPLVRLSDEELAAHNAYLDQLEQGGAGCLWRSGQ
ncbi:DNA polymerase III subunit epsilon [Gammaproteobacteria bacterium LSUCC0057]|uniref:DNA polymerase III subunit epsilon n=1 Tax=Gammaproteobacteria bacterium LSUCC0057 TaxID=2559237 RepID=A0A4Y8UL37_9GAMM|nr:DNA polymerase III subunit epsilon [Gammaproteobacteria bacterium LSUCC0057]